MKRNLALAGSILLLFFLLQNPGEALEASREGMKLWLNTLIPTLLPFLILTGFLVHTNKIEKLLSPLSVFWKTVFGLSPAGAYVFVLGILCGYPMGAKLASDLFTNGKISKREAEYLLTFANQPSPAFLNTYLTHVCLKQIVAAKEIYIILLLADIFCMLFFRFIIFRNQTSVQASPGSFVNSQTAAGISGNISKKETSTTSSPGSIIDVSIMNGFETIARLGGYILLFSLITACVKHYWKWSVTLRCLLSGLLEITTGLYQISLSAVPFRTQYLVSMALTASGGCCILAQTRSVTDKRLSILPYISAKVLNGAATVFFILVFSKFI